TDVRPGGERVEAEARRRPREGRDDAQAPVRAAGLREADPALGRRWRRELLQRPAVPRLEADLRRVANHEPARASGRMALEQARLPPWARPLSLVRLGRLRAAFIRALPDRRQRAVRRAELDPPAHEVDQQDQRERAADDAERDRDPALD